jgi:hypothetical protein
MKRSGMHPTGIPHKSNGAIIESQSVKLMAIIIQDIGFNGDYEHLPETSETLIYLAMSRIMVRQLA